ncbi:MAG: S8 family serine peptidase [Nitriliruptor sp.]
MKRTVVSGRWTAGLLAAALSVTGLGGGLAAADAGDPVDVIVLGSSSDAAADAVTATGGTVDVELSYLDAVAAEVSPAAHDALTARHDVTVALDEPVQVAGGTTLAELEQWATDAGNDPQLGAITPPALWGPEAGTGVAVALLDTGVADLPEFEGRLIHGPDYSGSDVAHVDEHGHGTFMAGLIAADGRQSEEGPARFGVAPGAEIVSIKLSGADGATDVSGVLQGIGWVIENQDDHGIRVMNLSLGVTSKRAPHADPLAQAAEMAWKSGITVVTASGNTPGTVTSPARSDLVLAVGSSDFKGTADREDDTLADHSGSDKVAGRERPDVLAPGTSVVSLRAPDSTIDATVSDVGEHHMRGTGTSMATAMVSGAVAVLAETRPLATPDDLKGALATTTVPVPGSSAGAIDLAAADAADPDPAWRQGKGEGAEAMPWNAHGAPGPDVTWQRLRWMDGEWQRLRWMDGEWARLRWMDSEWQRLRWMDTEWARLRWMDADYSRLRWMDTNLQRLRWMDANYSRLRWMDVDFSRLRWMSFDGPDLHLASAVEAPAAFGDSADGDRAADESSGQRDEGTGESKGQDNSRGKSNR